MMPEATDASGIQYSLLFSPPPQRAAAVALYAFWCEMERLSQTAREPAVASIKLAWWRDELDRTYTAKPLHPITTALAPSIARYRLPRENFTDLLAGVTDDLAQPDYATPTDIDRYCRAVGGNAVRLLARIFGATDRGADAYAADLGTALQLARLIQRATAARAPALRYFSRSPTTLQSHAERARRALIELGARPPATERAQQAPLAVLAAIAVATLSKIPANATPHERPIALSPVRMLWIAWRTAREAHR